MKLTILGCFSATPRALNNPSAQILEIRNHVFLIDCGEGTQVQLRKNKIKFSRIQHIFISHLHGDHFFGLPGLISTFRLLGREKELHVYGPKGIKKAITLLLKLGDAWTNFPLFFHELTSDEPLEIFKDETVSVSTIPLDHRIYTNGYLFSELQTDRKLNVEAVAKYQLDTSYFNNIKKGKDVVLDDGSLIPNAELSFEPPRPKHYAYCSDTLFLPAIIPLVKNVDALYHEATFLQTEEELATKTKHSTAKQAATIAKNADVGLLILGHYSTRYKNYALFKEEASELFQPVILAEDGLVINI